MGEKDKGLQLQRAYKRARGKVPSVNLSPIMEEINMVALCLESVVYLHS